MIHVTHYVRQRTAYSLEEMYRDVRAHMPADIEVTTCVSRFQSRGFFRRMYNVIRAPSYQGDINHVTGDVHFLTYLLRKRRTVLTILDCVTLDRLRGLRRFLLWLLWYWLPEKRCTLIVVISEATRQQVLRYLHCNEEKIKVVHCHVSDEFKASQRAFNRECPCVLLVGTTANKNIERTAEALRHLPCRVMIIGRLSESQISALQRNEIRYGNAVDISRRELVDHYERCDLVVFASTYEGFGLPIVEANAVGRPVVTGNVTSMPEVAADAACLVDPFSVTSIRAGILRVIEDEEYREDLVRRGFENVKRFRIEAAAARYAELYREVYARNRR